MTGVVIVHGVGAMGNTVVLVLWHYLGVCGGAGVLGQWHLMTPARHPVSHMVPMYFVSHQLNVGGRPVGQSIRRLTGLLAYF